MASAPMIAAPDDCGGIPNEAHAGFAHRLIDWQRRHGRHDLPWQGSRDPYRIWLAEVMLQQTQVATVIPYYRRFLDRFPDVTALAQAPQEAVLSLWSGLGYYARARHLHAAARVIVRDCGGRFPSRADELSRLPGIGRSTAAAIAAFASGERAAILDGNVKRVLARCFGIEGRTGQRQVESALWQLAESLLPERDMATYTQALMDLGATVCRRGSPDCGCCPLAAMCTANASGRQAELPVAPRRRKLPRRRQAVLVVVDRGRVLVEQRPPSGIWGGLLSLPEIEGDAQAACLQRFGLHALAAPLPPICHRFTHFELELHPYLCEVTGGCGLRENPSSRWLPFSDLHGAPLPSPIRRLLQGLAERPKP